MERLTDKLVALLACLPALALAAGGTADASVVVALLAAVISAAAGELARGWWRAAGAFALCLLGCALPPFAAVAGVAAYDLALVGGAAGGRARLLPAAAVLGPLACWATGALPATAALLALLGGAVGARMGDRAARLEAEVRARRRVRDELTATELSLARRNRELTEARDHEVALATLAERARIAREIHDNVGHLLTRGVVQVEALRVVGEGTPVAGGLAGVSDTLREALDEVRASVHDLRDDSCDLSVQARAAAERACAGTGVEVSCRVEAGEAPREVAACLLAVEREALSNALRHARDLTRVTVELVEHPALWRLTVTDDGAAPSGGEREEAPGAGRGMGLVSMEERVRALGGAFRAGRGPRGGWQVFASVPRGGAEGRGA